MERRLRLYAEANIAPEPAELIKIRSGCCLGCPRMVKVRPLVVECFGVGDISLVGLNWCPLRRWKA